MNDTTRRLPPYSEEAETGVLGSLLQSSEDAIDACVDANVTSDSFYIAANRAVFDAIGVLCNAGRAVDLLTTSDQLRTSKKIDIVGGEIYIHRLFDEARVSNVQHYVGILQEKWMLRKLIEQARQIENKACSGEVQAEELRSESEYAFGNLVQQKQLEQTNREILAEKHGEWEIAEERGCVGIETGFKVFDEYFGGLMDSALYYLSGAAGAAKTTLARNIVENIAMRGIPAGVFSLEQTKKDMWGSIAARHAKKSVFKLNQGRSGPGSLAELVPSEDFVAEWPIDIDDRPQTPMSLWSNCRRGVSKKGWQFIMLDYIQALDEDRDYGSLERFATHCSATVRNIAKTLHVPVLVISALSNSGRLRGSGMMAYDAWCHLEMTKSKKWPGELLIDVNVKKQRFGPPTTKTQLLLLGDEQRLTEPGLVEEEPEKGPEHPAWFDK